MWIKPQNGEGPGWQVLMMLDCVLQYGLSAGDYHPAELTYKRMHDLLDSPEKGAAVETARMDIILTDAMITLVNHLHYGKFNPHITLSTFDGNNFKGFHADRAIFLALQEKHP